MTLVGLLISLIVFVGVLAILYWAIHKLAGAFGLPPQILAVIDVILVVGVCLGLLLTLTGYIPIGIPVVR